MIGKRPAGPVAVYPRRRPPPRLPPSGVPARADSHLL